MRALVWDKEFVCVNSEGCFERHFTNFIRFDSQSASGERDDDDDETDDEVTVSVGLDACESRFGFDDAWPTTTSSRLYQQSECGRCDICRPGLLFGASGDVCGRRDVVAGERTEDEQRRGEGSGRGAV